MFASEPVTAAIIQFETDEGEWPTGLDDLVPNYLDVIPSKVGLTSVNWFYKSNDEGWELRVGLPAGWDSAYYIYNPELGNDPSAEPFDRWEYLGEY